MLRNWNISEKNGNTDTFIQKNRQGDPENRNGNPAGEMNKMATGTENIGFSMFLCTPECSRTQIGTQP